MKNLLLCLVFFFILSGVYAKENKKLNPIKLNKWIKVDNLKLTKPAFFNKKSVNDKKFKMSDLLKFNFKKINEHNAKLNSSFNWQNQKLKWKQINKNVVNLVSKNDISLAYVATYISVDRWTKASLKINTKQMCEIFVDGKKIKGKYTVNKDKEGSCKTELKLEKGVHLLVIKSIKEKNKSKWTLNANITPKKGWSSKNIEITNSPERIITFSDLLYGTKLSNSKISPSGKYAIINYNKRIKGTDKSLYWTELIELKSNKVISVFRGSKLRNLKFTPKSDKLCYSETENKLANIYTYDIELGKEFLIFENIKDLNSFYWAPNEKFIIYTLSEDYTLKNWKLKKLHNLDDRLYGYRYRSFLYKYDIKSKTKTRLTYGNISTSLNDISQDGKKIIFTQSRADYSQFPFRKQDMYILNLKNNSLETIWKDKLFSGYASFSPDGRKLLIKAGPSCFPKVGINNNNAPLVNNYDNQLFIYDIKTKKVDPITYNFNPSIKNSYWSKINNNIYIRAQDKDRVKLFVYNTQLKNYKEINTESDFVKNASFSSNSLKATFIASGISSPYVAKEINLKSLVLKTINNCENKNFENVKFGKTEDWDYTKKDGTKIIGRAYYPKNFNPKKKYPMIVYYYGGTSPVSRAFDGSYPFNLWASNGYIVYIMQPSGATGFGQEFSAKHQNNWCIITAEEIVNSTKAFVKAHKFVNEKKVGCLGASYGGFTTQYLQTYTDFFAAAISHAGISSISSYWGEGNWGFGYSTNASGHSYPWNNKKLYVDQSPLFNADKIKTPLLLLHGTIDDNVPPGESMQMYVALKLLNKEVEFIQLKNQKHFASTTSVRTKWYKTIMAWFDKYLKDQPQWWNNLYPKKNL